MLTIDVPREVLCEGLSQHPAKAYRRPLRSLIAAPCEGLSQAPAKPYRSTLRNFIARDKNITRNLPV